MVTGLMSRLRLPVIMSLTAGDARPREHEAALKALLSASADPVFSYPESLAALREGVAAEVRSGATHLAVAGGDGTMHHVVNALGGAPVIVVPIPIGSGNDFSRALGIGLDVARAVQALADRRSRTIDLIEVNGRRVCTVAGAGLVADTGLQVGRLLGARLGVAASGEGPRPICLSDGGGRTAPCRPEDRVRRRDPMAGFEGDVVRVGRTPARRFPCQLADARRRAAAAAVLSDQ